MRDKSKTIIRDILKWGSLTCFLGAVSIILVEAAIPSDISAGQSNNVAGVVQDELDKNHDKETIKEIENFNIDFIDLKDTYFVGETLKYSISYTPVDTSYKNISYSISDSSLLKIDSFKNEITFLKEGEAKVTFESEKNKELKKSFDFTIKNIEPTSLKLNTNSLSMNIGDSYTLNYEISPSNVTLKDVSFVSSNPKVISVDNNGTVKALEAGESTIKAYFSNYESIYDEVKLKVNPKHIEEVETITANKIEIYNKQTKEFYGEFLPVTANFDSSKLSFSSTDKKLTITKSKVDKSKGRFYFKVKYDNSSLVEEKEIEVTAKYLDKVTTFIVKVLPQVKLSNEVIDTKKLKLEHDVSIISSSYYPAIKDIPEEVEISIPFIQDVSKNQAKYALKDYFIEVNNNLSVISSSYNKIKLQVTNTNVDSEIVKYYFDKNSKEDYIAFTLNFKRVSSNDHIVDISLNKFYEDKELVLSPNETYKDVFNGSIKSSTANSPLNKTPINVTVDSASSDILEIEYDKNFNATSLKTLKPGKAKIIVTSRLEDSINSLKKVEKIYNVKVDEFVSSSFISVNSNEFKEESYEIDKTKRHELLLNFKKATTFADGTNIEHEDPILPYDVSLNTNEFITFDKETNEIRGIKNGETIVLFTPKDKKYSEFTKSIKIIVNHIDIDLKDFKMNFKLTSSDEYNKVDKDFSMIPLKSTFKVSSIVNENASNKNVRYISSNPDIISINQETGEAKALKVGKAIITCYSEDSPNIKITKSIDVINTSSPFTIDTKTLKPHKFEEVKDKNNKFSHYYIGLNFGESYKLKISPIDTTSTSSKLQFVFENSKGEASDDTIISIDKEGNIVTKNTGKTWVKICYGDNEINTYTKLVQFDVYRQNQMPFKDMAYKLRKLIGHFGLFAATATSGLLFIFLQFKGTKLQAIMMVIYTAFGVFIAFISEWVQSFVPGRGCTLKDALLNSFGFSVVTLTILALLIVLSLLHHFKTLKDEKDFIKEIERKKNS